MNTMKLAPMAAVVVAMALAACAQQPRRDTPMTQEPPRDRRATPVEPIRATAPAAAPTPSAAAAAPAGAAAPSSAADPLAPIGVLPCDAYLARYRTCHETIAMIEPGLIDERRTRLHSTFLARASDPQQREDLKTLCEGMQKTMDDALNGRECGSPPTRTESDFFVE